MIILNDMIMLNKWHFSSHRNENGMVIEATIGNGTYHPVIQIWNDGSIQFLNCENKENAARLANEINYCLNCIKR